MSNEKNMRMFLISGIALILCIGMFLIPNAHAGLFGLESNKEGVANGGSLLTGALQTTGLMAANFVVPSMITNMVAGGNETAKATQGLSSGLGSAGALVGGAIFGQMGGMIGGAVAALAGGLWGGINNGLFTSGKGKTLYSIDRGILTRIIALDIKTATLKDADYKIKGSDSPSDKFTTNFDKDRQFLKKEKGVQYRYTPVMIKNNATANASRNAVETAVLAIDTFGLPDYSNSSVVNPSAIAGQNAQNPYMQQLPNGMNTAQDPYADALPLGDAAKQTIGWCEVNNQNKLTTMDKKVSDSYVTVVAEKAKKPNTETFVLLLKNLQAEQQQINIPSYNCFGPEGLSGVTGEEYRPKVEYKWTWKTVGKTDYCSKSLDDEERVYCDSTQFMESLLARLSEFSLKMNSSSEINSSDFTSTSDLDVNTTNGNTIYNILNFKASLMKDGYTLDFLNDFKEYVTSTSYLGFSEIQKTYTNTFLPEKISFRPLSGASTSHEGYKLQYAGYYNVTIEVVYNAGTGDHQLITATGAKSNDNVKQIIVYFEPISQENNPIYYMPLDATVGVKNGIIDRVGYGVEYTSSTNSSVWFSKNQEEGILLEPTLRSNSTPIVSLDMTVKSDVSTLNGTMRGAVLQIIPKSTSAGASYSVNRFLSLPSYADMTVTKKSDGGAYAYYSVDFGQGPETAGTSFIRWNLICDKESKTFECESFSGLKPTDEMYIPDISGTKAEVAPTGQLQGKVYGLEWIPDAIIRDGKHTQAMYRGLVYMPEVTGGKSLRLEKVIASDDMTITNTQSSYSELRDIQEILDLMKENVICMSNEVGGTGIRFWWNPCKVMDNCPI